jgi:hypothetical protein
LASTALPPTFNNLQQSSTFMLRLRQQGLIDRCSGMQQVMQGKSVKNANVQMPCWPVGLDHCCTLAMRTEAALPHRSVQHTQQQ